MKKIDLERKFLTLKTEVSGATFNENDVRKYATKNKVEDLLDLIKKAEAALESLKRKEKINDLLHQGTYHITGQVTDTITVGQVITVCTEDIIHL